MTLEVIAGVAARLPALAGQKSREGALALRGDDDPLRSDLARHIVTAATPHVAPTLECLQTGPGIGHIVRRVLLDEMHDLHRCPRGQAFGSSCHRVKWRTASAGKRYRTAGTKSGHADLTWAFAAATGLWLRDQPAGPKYLARLEQPPGQGKALTVLAQQLARAVYTLCTRDTTFDMPQFLQLSGRGACEPAVSLDTQGLRLRWLCCPLDVMASANAKEGIGLRLCARCR